jgi:hypothetical protein
MQQHAGALGSVIAGVLILGIVGAVTKSVDDGPAHPDAWDPRVAGLVDFVQSARDLDFDHPVYVDFLSPGDYTEATTSDEEGLDDEGRASLERYAGELRALGVASGELDLFTAFNQVSDTGTLAFYDPITERVRVRGTELTVGLQVTLVHELTHALQDQHFDLERIYDDDLDSSASEAFRGLVEGDATRIEDEYVSGELTGEEQAAYDEEYDTDVEESEASMDAVPAFVNATFGVPYLLGQPFAQMLVNEGGNDAVDDAFRHPPHTEEHLFDPTSFMAEQTSTEIDLDLGDDVDTFDEGPFGSPSWYLVLAERIDPLVAFDAALGWDGDAYAAYEEDGRTCLRAAFVGDTAADETAMTDALTQWAAVVPGGQVELLQVDGHPAFEACDPGEDVDMALTDRSQDALLLPSLWGYLVADAATVLDADGARCYARNVLGELTYDQIVDPEGAAFQGDAFQQHLEAAFRLCT